MTDRNAARREPDAGLHGRYPHVAYLLGAYLFADDSLEFEIGELVTTEGSQRAGLVLDEVRGLLADTTVGEEELTAFVRATTPWLVRTGRGTLRHVVDRLAEALGKAAPR